MVYTRKGNFPLKISSSTYVWRSLNIGLNGILTADIPIHAYLHEKRKENFGQIIVLSLFKKYHEVTLTRLEIMPVWPAAIFNPGKTPGVKKPFLGCSVGLE